MSSGSKGNESNICWFQPLKGQILFVAVCLLLFQIEKFNKQPVSVPKKKKKSFNPGNEVLCCGDSLSTSRCSLAGDSDSIFDFPAPVNNLLSKLTKVIILLQTLHVAEHQLMSRMFFCVCLKRRATITFLIFISVPAYEISVCVLPGRRHVSSDQRLHPGHLNSVNAHKVAPPLGFLRQQPRR